MDASFEPASQPKSVVDVAVVGAGFGGVLAALRLKTSGRSFVLLERGPRIGGVWRDNIYPGCTCDIRSQLYSLRQQPNPNWSSNYAGQAEILAYLEDVVQREGLDAHLQLSTEITEAVLVENAGYWRLRHADGAITLARIVILALGPHSRPHVPPIPGIDTFNGPSFHSARWDSSFDAHGKRVAVIGTAASAVQIIPGLVGRAAHVAVFQRSPNWIIPRQQRRLTGFERWLFRHAPATQALGRCATYWAMELAGTAVLGPGPAAQVLTAAARWNLRAVRDPMLRRRLTPDYPIGCKRILVSDDYFPSFNRPEVELVTSRIEAITNDGARTNDGVNHHFDALVWATGFYVADPVQMLRVVGCGGRELAVQWSEQGMQGFLGVNIANYPNLAVLLGPNSGPPASSAIHVMESQMHYLERYIAAIAAAPQGALLDVKPEVQDAFNADIQRRLARTAWNAGCASWYIDRRGRNTTMYPGITSQYRRLTSRFDISAYRWRDPRHS